MTVFSNRHQGHRKLLWLALTAMLCNGVKAQVPSGEQASFSAAVTQTAPDLRIHALQQFLLAYPHASRRSAAQQLLLEAYLNTFPEPTGSIHALATAQIAAASPGVDRWTEEARIADLLANAGEHGADLSDAEVWAQDAVTSMTEPAYRQQMARMQTRYKLSALTPRQLQHQFRSDRAACLAALANVSLRQGQVGRAEPFLQEALRLDPRSSESHRLAGELALVQGQKEKALSALIQANALGPIPTAWRKQEEDLFEEEEHGNVTALEDRIDTAYRAAYPSPFSLPNRQLPPGGHPVLLELFTGSDCAPCAGPDLAVDSLLGAYRRSDLVALEFDEHVPRPDPLATPATVARADFYGVGATPTAFLDGQSVDLLGSSRQDVANIVVNLADQVEDRAPLPSGLHLSLAANWTGANVIHSTAAIAQLPIAVPAASSTGDASLRALARAVVNIALVEDDLRYLGKNGVRFHRMVVRALQQAPAVTFLAGLPNPSVISFDPKQIQTEQSAYLSDYEIHNDRFGVFRFPTRELPIRLDRLAVVAWVQDPASRTVLQSAFVAVPPR